MKKIIIQVDSIKELLEIKELIHSKYVKDCQITVYPTEELIKDCKKVVGGIDDINFTTPTEIYGIKVAFN